MSVLTDLRAALDAKQEAEAEHRLARRGNDHDEKVAAAECVNRAIDDLGSLLTDDTIRALLDVADAARVVRIEPRWCDARLESDYACEDCDGCDAEANYDRFRAALALLVKEADHE